MGVVGLALALTLSLWAKWALFLAAGLPLVFLLIGQSFFPHSKRSIRLWMNPDVVSETDEVRLRLSGEEVTLDFFKRWHDFKVVECNVWLLITIGLLSLGALAGVYAVNDLPMPGYSYLYYGGSFWLPICYLAWRWIWERRAMRATGIAMGPFRVARLEKPPFMKRVTYHFNDDQGAYHGGSFRTLFCDTSDDLTVIFFDESHPEVSVPASAMMFHKLKWKEPEGIHTSAL
jgi:hypothetical protein